jgi:hypothetical protein
LTQRFGYSAAKQNFLIPGADVASVMRRPGNEIFHCMEVGFCREIKPFNDLKSHPPKKHCDARGDRGCRLNRPATNLPTSRLLEAPPRKALAKVSHQARRPSRKRINPTGDGARIRSAPSDPPPRSPRAGRGRRRLGQRSQATGRPRNRSLPQSPAVFPANRHHPIWPL